MKKNNILQPIDVSVPGKCDEIIELAKALQQNASAIQKVAEALMKNETQVNISNCTFRSSFSVNPKTRKID